ncbi:MAG: hypothetical protein V3U29_09495 [Phycisphaeraceae bacterium]
MQPIRIILTRRSEYVPGDAFEVFGDKGTGTVDFDHSLTTRAVPLWLDAPPVAAHLLGGHLTGVHLDGIFPAGHLQGVHLGDGHLVPESAIVWESESYVFGLLQHVLKMVDAVGNRSLSPWPTFTDTVNSAPRPPKRFEKIGYDSITDQVRFSIEARQPLAEGV